MKFYKRSLLPVAIATLLPTLVFATVALYFGYLDHRKGVEDAATERAQTVMSDVDAQMRSDMSALNVLATSPFIDEADWAHYYMRIKRVQALYPHWLCVSVVDLKSHTIPVDTRLTEGATEPAPDLAFLQQVAASKKIAFKTLPASEMTGGVPLVAIFQPVLRGDDVRYVLVLAVSPRLYQSLLLDKSPPDTVSAIVDENGLFIARNIDYEKRMGTPGTHFLREAVAGGAPQGFYRATTYEGFKNYTAFVRSTLTGWSTHFAVASGLIDGAKSWSVVTIAFAAIASLSLGVLLVLIVAKDISDRQRADDRLRQAQKMEAVGQLTGGIAHDFNNLLTAIIGNLEMLSNRLGEDEKMKRRADNALDAAQRAARLTAQLLAFSRPRNIDRAVIDLQKLTENLRDLLLHSIGSNVTLKINVSDNARHTMGDANQIETALINLAVNARDAMPPDGGVLTIFTQPYQRDARDGLPPGDFLELCVRDTGSGMSEDTKARALEPFFTTKPVGRGTGLGLSQVFGVVRQSGGDLKIDSAPGAGTTIRMILPRALPADITDSRKLVQPPSAEPRKEMSALRILVLDDEPAIRELICETLAALGHGCETAASCVEAQGLLIKQHFDLLITDYAMPDQNGAEMAAEARLHRPDIKVLFVSGFADNDEIERAVAGAPILRKPFTIQELETAIRACLDDDRMASAV